MIKEKEVIVSINPSNHEHFKNLGYNGKFKDQIKVNVLHLLEHSNVYITAICDNPKCKKEFSIRYSDYKSALIKETQEYYCNKCTKIRRHKVAEIKNNKGLLKRGQLYYFNFIENVICEIKKYLKKYKTFEHLPTNDGGLYQAILYYSKNIYEFANKYGFEEYIDKKPVGYYNNLDNLINEINNFIQIYNRFPSQQELKKDLKIHTNHIYKHFESINELKKYLNYNDNKDLIDNRGDYNNSLLEVYVANYLIAQRLGNYYKREQHPFPKEEGNHRSDFTFYLDNDKELHIEVWGYSKNDNSSPRSIAYNKKRPIKEKLYEKYKNKLILVSLEYKDLCSSYEQIQNNIYEKLNDYLNLPFKNVEFDLIKSYKDLTDYEMFKELLKFSGNNSIPSKDLLCQTPMGKRLYNTIIRKFKGFNYFYNKYKIEKINPIQKWNEQLIYEKTFLMLKRYNKFVSYKKIKEYNDKDFIGFHPYFNQHGGYKTYQIKFCEYCLINNINISKYFNIYEFIYKHATQNAYNHLKITLEQKQLAQNILNTYFNNFKKVYGEPND